MWTEQEINFIVPFVREIAEEKVTKDLPQYLLIN